MSTTNTPGYNTRIAIWFETDGKGRKVAYYWSTRAMRAIRLKLVDAETFIANGTADRIAGHPMRRP